MIVVDRQAAQKAGAEGDVLGLASTRIHLHDITASAVEQQDMIAVNARRMGHRQLIGNDPVVGDVDEYAAFGPARTPAVDHVRTADRRDIARLAFGPQRHAVKVAAILGGQSRDKGRLPDRPEAVPQIKRGETGIAGVDEYHPARVVDADFVHVEVAGGLRIARHEGEIERLVGDLAGPKHILEPPELKLGGEVKPPGLPGETHRPVEILLVERNRAVALNADQEQLAGLIGGEGEAGAVAQQPTGKTA
jgi:hypothetical protein